MDGSAVVNQLVSELKVLRRSRGVDAKEINERIGDALRMTCGIAEQDGAADIRRKLRRRLSQLAGQLPWDLKVLAQAAFALVPEAHQAFYGERLDWAATHINRQERTLRRRADEAMRQLAELAAAELPVAGTTGWHIETLRALCDLAPPAPEIFQFHTVVADQDELSEIDLTDSVGEPRVLYGGLLTNPSTLAFPEPLGRGDRHEFGLCFRPRADIEPHFVSIVRQPCANLEIRVKFAAERVPSRVWLLSGVPATELADPARRGAAVHVDAAAELRVRFTAPDPGLAHGVGWVRRVAP
ncbi:MAG TPA: hypothetical protein VG247_19090 [Pseudonocardiaceae bacterium]|jgi:hypothetical protein|nr:hypothetical protein [Pseudonocardiaceae bacterium]